MNGSSLFPVSRSADQLLHELREEVLRLEQERARFHELLPGDRLDSLDAYNERIRVRRELLDLLDSPRRTQ